MNSLFLRLEKTHENRGISLRALGGSLALHVLVLAVADPWLPVTAVGVPSAGRPLEARLTAQTVATPAVAVRSVPTAARPPSLRQRIPALRPAEAVNTVQAPRPPAAGLAGKAETGAMGEDASGEPAARDFPGATSVVLAASGVAAAEPGPGPDAAGLREYRLALAGEARRFRHYPETARRAGLAGVAEVRVVVRPDTQRQAELARSSGHALLDEAALTMLRAASARAELPVSLRGQAFAVSLPVVFEVDE